MIEADALTALEARAELTALVPAGNIAPAGTLEAPGGNYITYFNVSADRNSTIVSGCGGLRNARVQYNCWSDTYGDSKAIAEEVITAITGSTDFTSTVQLEQDDYDGETKTHRVILDFSIWQNV